jgi:hypothetical protein
MLEIKNAQDIEKLQPQKIMGSFAKNRVLLCIGIALVLHVVIIGGTSVPYIYYNFVNKEAGEARRKAIEDERKAREAAKKAALASALRAAVTNAPAASTNAPARAAADAAPGSTEGVPEKYKDAPVVKQITEKATPPPKPDKIRAFDDDNP